MSLASPDKLIWLLIALPIIGFYILKTRLRRRPVSTLLFWDQVFEQKRQRSLWQNLRHWMSLLLQLFFVGLLGFALADPLWESQDDTGQDLILVIDNSASMQAVDPASGKTRLEAAIEKAIDVAGTLRGGDNIALVVADGSVRVVVGMSDFAPTVIDALREIRPSDGPTNLAAAIAAARRLASDDQTRRVVVFSDGCVSDRDQLADSIVRGEESAKRNADAAKVASAEQSAGAEDPSRKVQPTDPSPPYSGPDVRWIQVGATQDNIAITTFQVRRSTVDPIGYALLVEVNNYSEQPVETRLTLNLDETLVDVIPMEIEPGGVFRKQIDSTSQSGGVLVGRLRSEDALPVDNEARAIVPPRPMIPVRLVVGEESDSYYLKRVLESIPLVRIEDETNAAASDANRLHVFAGVVPELIPDGPLLLVDLPGSGPPIDDSGPLWKLGPEIESPIIAKQEKDSPLLRHVQLQNVIIAGGRDLEVSESLGPATTLFESAEGARICVAVEREAGRILLLASDLDSSDLPLRIAFPVLMTNAMNWFFRETGEIRPALATGQVANVPWDFPGENDQPTTARLVGPDQHDSLVTVESDEAKVGPLNAVGVYRLTNKAPVAQSGDGETEATSEDDLEVLETQRQPDGQDALIAVNLADANESDLRVPELPETTAEDLPPARRSPWFYLILAASGLILTEWVLFQRRVVA